MEGVPSQLEKVRLCLQTNDLIIFKQINEWLLK